MMIVFDTGCPAGFQAGKLLVLAGRLQLSAGGQNIAATRHPDGCGKSAIVDNFGKAFDGGGFRAFKLRSRPLVKGDQVELGRYSFNHTHQFAGVCGGIVYAFQHDVFKGDAPGIVRTGIFPTGLKKFL